jgi:hypothetical protein
MSEVVCHTLGLAYDPSIVLHMQSANGTLDQSLGLSRNVPFTIGKITMYLQVHVISLPAYNVLLEVFTLPHLFRLESGRTVPDTCVTRIHFFLVKIRVFVRSFSGRTICPPDFPAGQSMDSPPEMTLEWSH